MDQSNYIWLVNMFMTYTQRKQELKKSGWTQSWNSKSVYGYERQNQNLAKKNYENLVEVLTNNAIDTDTNSSNPTLLSLQSSSTFPKPNWVKVTFIEWKTQKFIIIVRRLHCIGNKLNKLHGEK